MTNNLYWLRVAKELYRREIAKPVFWLGDDIHYEEAKKTFKTGVFKLRDMVHYPFSIKTNHYKSEHNKFFYTSNYFKAKDICIKMMDRLDFYGNFSRIDREATFHRLVILILTELSKSKPEALIMSENAHSHPQYLILEICKFLNIPIIKFNSWGLISPLMFIQNVTTGKIIDNNFTVNPELDLLIKKDLNSFINITVKRKLNDGYISSIIINQKKNILKRFNFKILLKKIIYDLKNEFFLFRKNLSSDYYSINPYKFNFFIRNKILKNKANNLKKMFNRNVEIIKEGKDFVYFALHFEPERTTTPDGDFFHDQFLALVTLRKLIPKNILIYVKEHPSQFILKKKGTLGRSPLFYDLIKNIEGVKLISLETDSYKLIKESKFVSTITGTVALEAALMGNTALIFGDAWFKDCPNIIQWKQNLTYKKIISKKNKGYKDITLYLNNFIKNSFPGCINGTTKDYFSDSYNLSFKESEYTNVLNALENYFLNY